MMRSSSALVPRTSMQRIATRVSKTMLSWDTITAFGLPVVPDV